MLSQKLQDDLMSAYQQVHEAKRGHAAGDSDVEKQASQLASDVRYKAKGKVKEGASEEEKKKVFMQILGASPAPTAVKSMAKTKLLGEERFPDGPEGTAKRLRALAKKRKIPMDKMKKHPQFQPEEFAKTGMAKGSGKPGGAMKKYLENAKKKKEKVKMGESKGADAISKKAEKLTKQYNKLSKAEKANPAFQPRELNPKPVYSSHELQGEVVSEMGGMKVKSKPKDKNPQNMALPKDAKSGVNYQAMSQSYEPVGNIFNEKKMDPVGKEDKDIDNDGDHDSTDKYLLNRRKAISKAIAKKRGKVKEGFSAWRIDLDFNEQVKK